MSSLENGYIWPIYVTPGNFYHDESFRNFRNNIIRGEGEERENMEQAIDDEREKNLDKDDKAVMTKGSLCGCTRH